MAAGTALCLTTPAWAAQAQPSPPLPAKGNADIPDDESPDIVVRGQPPRGSAIGDIPPEQSLSPADIRAYGVSSISDLLDELSPETTSVRGRGGEAPVVLLNGRRISSFAEIRDIPTEAIERVDILPEEVALKYGFSADQKVVNFVLRRRFRAITGEMAGGEATAGGGASGTGDLNLLRIHRDQRFSVDLKYQQADQLLESDRGLMTTATRSPYGLPGNITAPAGGEIDPALSALVGRPVTIAGVPASAANGAPALGDFVAGASHANLTDVSPYRTLMPATKEGTLNTVYSRNIGDFGVTVNGTLDISTSDALQGLPGAALLVPAGNPFSPFGRDVSLNRYLSTNPLTQGIDSLTGHFGFTVNRDLAHWRLSLTGNYDYADSRTRTETGIDVSALQASIISGDPTINPFGPLGTGLLGPTLVNRARAISNSGNVQLVASGPLIAVPAGSISTTVKAGFEDSNIDSLSVRAALVQTSALTRGNLNGQVNVDVPITSRKNHVLGAIGDLSVNGNVAVRRLSDFGVLTTTGYGLTWKPRDKLTFIASVTNDQGAPTIQQIGNPLVLTPGVTAFDYLTGRTVSITQTGGGNATLKHDDRHVFKLGLTAKPLAKADLTLTASFVKSSIRNAIASFPEPTAAIEQAFPDRFTRDEDGELTAIDARPINFAREDSEELRIGFNFSQPLKPSPKVIAAFRALRRNTPPDLERLRRLRNEDGPPPPPPSATPPSTPGDSANAGPAGNATATGNAPSAAGPHEGGGPGGGRGPGGFGGRGRAQAGGRIQFAVYDTITFRDDILIRPGLPVLDLLNGGSIGSSGGQPRHQVNVQLGYSNNGIGARLTGSWQSATSARDPSAPASANLHFSDLATANLRLFADLGQIPSLMPHAWARGARVSLLVTNVLDAQLQVRDANGNTPLRYDPAYLNPLGRSFRLSVRKLFF